MKKFPVILDIETKYSFRQYADPKKLGITVVGLYDYRDQKAKVFVEKELPKLYSFLEASSYIIGFNVRSFDLQVLQGYYPGRIHHFSIFDILDDIRIKIGRRLSLNDLIFATLGKKKTGHGLLAIELYKEGKWEDLKKYCLDDVMLTKELFEFGVEKGEVMYLNEKGKVSIKVDWKKYLKDPGKSESHLTLPF
ncbi:ribonuclease H-like domain-containing protein [Candidatus Roizmanbacteria bacterium]|nr:ribonuclease H-like domain-containing protein [Candidatus Roizmanbacteria bacterium]